MTELTPSQQKALSQNRHLAVTANAGSGKTRVMVERFVRLFELRQQHVELSVQNVVAITFTENAGAELRKKILTEVNRRIAGLPREDDRRLRLVRLRDALPAAMIGTIHSFAARMLKAYPVEANVDASFGILQGADERLMREDVIERVFYAVLEHAYKYGQHPDVLALFRTLGRSEVRNLVRTLLSKRALAAKFREQLLSKSDADILTEWRQELEPFLRYPLRARAVLTDIEANLKSGDKADEVRPLFAPYFAAKTPIETAHAFAALAALLISDTGLHSNRVNKKSLAPDRAADIEEFIAVCREHKSILASLPATEEEWILEHRQYLALMRAALSLADVVTSEYASEKQSYGVLDFDDLVLKFELLLREERVRDELSRQFQFIMIDEYQDTDATQFELAKRLTKDLTASNLMVVGDPKQSIYGFRNADVSVFRDTAQTIVAQTLTKTAEAESSAAGLLGEEAKGSLSLAESFRMASVPLAAINRVFRGLMAPSSNVFAEGHEVEYTELVHGRISAVPGGVEWICPQSLSKNDEASDDDVGEFELIARKIQSIMGGSDPRYQIEDSNVMRAPRYDDIAILLRTRTPLPQIEQALRSANIPFVIAKGAGFFLQQEVLDAISYLSFLIAPHDDLSLVAILRSPFFALSDVDLYQIAGQNAEEKNLSFWERLQRFTTSSARILHASEQLRGNLAIAGRTSAAFLLSKIFEETGIYATLSSRADSRQKIANLEKLLGMARASDASGFSSLFDFVERVRYLIGEDEKESQADAVRTKDAVQIMTVHGAKGLEFPIVILPKLERGFKYDQSGMLEPELGLHIRIPEADRQPFIAEYLRERSHARTDAEEKRILYVAMTRARDHLILSSTLPKKRPSTNWLAWIGEAFPQVFEQEYSEISLTERILRYDGKGRTTNEEQVQIRIPLIRTAADISVAVESNLATPRPAFVPLYIDAVKSGTKSARYSATQLLRYKECPTKYHLSYVLGIPEESGLAIDLEEAAEKDSISGSLLGQVVHQLLAKAHVIAPNATIDESIIAREIDTILFSLEVWDHRNEISTIAKEHVEKFFKSDLAKDILGANEYFVEYSLQTQAPDGNILFGIIDRLYKDADGTWTILDYKTERGKDHANSARYEFQMRFYAYLVQRLYPDAKQIRAKLFYTDRSEIKEYTFGASDFSALETECLELISKINRDANIQALSDLQKNLDHCKDCKFADEAVQCIVVPSKPNTHAGQVAEFA